MNYARLIELRGRMALWLAERMTSWAVKLRMQATRDSLRSMKPELPLFDRLKDGS